MMAFEELHELWDYYVYLESSLIDTIQIIPLKNNGKTYSPKLYDIFRSACSQFESLLKMIFTHLGLSPAPEKCGIMRYYIPFNEFGLLYHQTVLFRKYPHGTPICPFRYDVDLEKSFTNKSKFYSTNKTTQPLEKPPSNYCINMLPVWWIKHNKTKHDLPKGYKEGNLQNTCFSLAGLYTFHVMADYLKYYSQTKNFLNPTSWSNNYPILTGAYHDKIVEDRHNTLKSELFISTISQNV